MDSHRCFWACVVAITSVALVTEGGMYTDFAVIASGNALRKFMNTVTEVISYRNLYRQFEKPGTYDDAVKDFEKLLPRNVKELKLPGGVEGKMGDVYDRIVIIRSNSELGKPMMTIGHKDQKLDRIVYTD